VESRTSGEPVAELRESPDEVTAAVRLLERHPDFRVLRRLGTPSVVSVQIEGAASRAAVVDVETTGTGPDDRLVELAALIFEYDPANGRMGRVLDTYDALEDPGRPIPPEAVAIHGITDAMVAGQALDEARVRSLFDGVGLDIAHNAKFDRQFLERRLDLFAALPWACSYEQIPWAEEGLRGGRLEYLAMEFGFFYEAHRRATDCEALLQLLRQTLPRSGVSAFEKLLADVQNPAYSLAALDSPFEKKELLKTRGYRWDDKRRVWHRVVPHAAAKAEAEWLKAEIYGGLRCRIEVEKLDALIRFSGRSGPRRVRTI